MNDDFDGDDIFESKENESDDSDIDSIFDDNDQSEEFTQSSNEEEEKEIGDLISQLGEKGISNESLANLDVEKKNIPQDLLGILDTSDDEDGHYQAVVTLSQTYDLQYVSRFIELLSDNNLEIRECFAKFLGEVGDEKAVEPLIRTLASDSQNMKYIAVSSLGQIGSELALTPLIELLEEPDEI